MAVCAASAAFAKDDPAGRYAEAERLFAAGKFAKAASAYEMYISGSPGGKLVAKAHEGAFRSWLGAENESRAQKAGKRLFKRFPEAKQTLTVLASWIEQGWSVPRLKTSYDVLRKWTFDRIDGRKRPDVRLGFLAIIDKQHRRSKLVKGKGILYCQAWAHLQAKRHDEAIALGKSYLAAKPRGDYSERTRLVVAQAMVDSSPPRTEEAAKILKVIVDDPDSRSRDRARELLAQAGAGPASIQITEGFPTAEGLGHVVVLTNLPSSHARRRALEPWRKARDADVVTFRGREVLAAASDLRKLGAEHVAVVVEPDVVDNDFQLAMLELCRGLDEDPMPDFHFGYLVTRDAEDLAKLTTRILEKEKTGGTRAKTVFPTSEKAVSDLDFLLHYGHGTSRGVVDAMSAKQVAQITLADGPVIVSGACFNGVCARTHERYSLGNFHGKPAELAADEVLSLAWIHAGATGLFAALDGDRGEMAAAEWEHFLEHAPTLGAVMSYQYRLVWTSLPEWYEGFPRYTPGKRKDKSFYGVMLRGQTSRILISDPKYRPLHAPLTKPTTETTATRDENTGAITVRVQMLRHANGPFVNTLTRNDGIPFKETRLYVRVPLPRGADGTFTFPTAEAGALEIARVQAKHEVWGGRRYVNLQAESADWKLTRKGTVTTFTLAPTR